jgi:beta-lactamase regulating signal transducer with metallopeptidase domain
MNEAGIGAWADAMGRAAWQGGLAILVVWGICRLVPAVPPVVRCWLWRLVYLKLIVALLWTAPMLLPVLPAETVAVSTASEPGAAPPPSSSIPPADPEVSPGPAGSRPSAPPASGSPVLPMLFTLWLLGVCACTAHLAARWQWTRRLRRSCRVVDEAALLQLRSELCRSLGIRDEPPLVCSGQIERPVLLGLWRSEVVLPLRLLQTSHLGDLRLVLAHELAHLKRRDLQWAWLPAAVRALFFFHPLVWLADAEWRLAQELACDELTLRAAASSPAEYGRLLLKVTTGSEPVQPAGLPAVAIVESYDSLRRRLHALRLLRPLQRAHLVTAATCLAMLALIGVVPWRAVAGARVSYLDLRPVGNQELDSGFGSGKLSDNSLAELPRGEQVLAGFRFRVEDRGIQLMGKVLGDRPTSVSPIRVDRRFSTLAVLHATAWGGQAPGKEYHTPDGTPVGEYRVHYAGGDSEVIPVVYGEDLRDWWVPGRDDGPVSRGRLAWTGHNGAAGIYGNPSIRLYASQWKNPRPHQQVSHIEFVSLGEVAAPFCIAMTCGD